MADSFGPLTWAPSTKARLGELNPAANVRRDSPPTFLWQTTTDELVPPSNAIHMYEALVGAGLVRFGLVDKNDSIARAVVMAIHLINTSLLTGAITFAACRAQPGPAGPRPQRAALWLGTAIVGLLVVGVSGAVTALGDTLFPAQAGDLAARIAEDHGAGAHFLQRLRVFHPFIAVGLGLYVLVVANALSGPQASAAARRWGGVVMLGVLVQVAAGVVNILLSAPGWLQVVHLLLGTGLWVALITFALAVLGPRRPA